MCIWDKSESPVTSPGVRSSDDNSLSSEPPEQSSPPSEISITNCNHDQTTIPLPLTSLYSHDYTSLDDASLKKSALEL